MKLIALPVNALRCVYQNLMELVGVPLITFIKPLVNSESELTHILNYKRGVPSGEPYLLLSNTNQSVAK